MLAALCVATAACSSSSHTATTAPPKATTSSSAPSPNTTDSLRARDQATASSIVLRAADLPGVWVAGPTAVNDQTGDAQVTHCLGIPNSDGDETSYAGSPQFTQSSIQIDTRTLLYNSTAVVQSDLRATASPNFVSCETRLLASATNGGATVLHLTKSVLPTTAGTVQGFRFSGSFEANQASKHETISFDEVALAHGRVEVSINISAINAPLPAGLMDRATAAMTRRLLSGSVTA
jgi:hypothetical protein